MVVCSISVVPIGTGSTSVSDYVAGCQEILGRTEGIRYRLTPMATVLEGELETIMETVAKLHRSPFDKGAGRVMTTLVIDERTDAGLTMDGKIDSVRKKLERDS